MLPYCGMHVWYPPTPSGSPPVPSPVLPPVVAFLIMILGSWFGTAPALAADFECEITCLLFAISIMRLLTRSPRHELREVDSPPDSIRNKGDLSRTTPRASFNR